MDPNEQVLVFPEQRLKRHLPHFKDGVLTDPALLPKVLDDVLSTDATLFVDRGLAETDPFFKQVIPYCVLWGEDAPYSKYSFAYQRTKKGGEDRLHDKWSIGVGGHVNPCDQHPHESAYVSGLRRELLEEVGLELPLDVATAAPVIALIYDPSDDVGKVHFGVVHLVKVPDMDAIQPTDPALATGMWMSHRSLWSLAQNGRMENWSRLVHKHVRLPG